MKNKPPVRVAQVIGKMWAGGVEAVVFNYYRELDKTKVQFDFYYDEDSTVEPPLDLIEMGANFFKLPPYQKLLKYILTLKSYFENNNYIIVHSHLNTLSIFPLFVAKLTGIPVRIAHNHSVPNHNDWKRNMMKHTLKFFSRIFSTDYFACSEKAGRWLFGNNLYEKGCVKIVRNAIDFSRFNISEEEKKKLLTDLKLEDRFVIGHVGRFTFAKNHKFLISIFKEIKNIKPEAILLLVGDGELRNSIIKQIKQLELTDSVIMLGKTKYPELYYPIMNVLVLPSFFEGLPMTTIEAQVSGIPILISEAIPEEAIISNGCTYISLKDDVSIWAKLAINTLNKNVKLSCVSEIYNINQAAPDLVDWYINRQADCKK